MDEVVPSTASSPGRSPVNLNCCLEELLRFTLASYVDGTLQQQLDLDDDNNKNRKIMSLSKDYCLQLLHQDHFNLASSDSTTSPVEGVPSHPLYKRLATSLLQSISSGTIFPPYNKATMIHGDDSLKDKEDEWNMLISEGGTKLVTMLQTVDFELHVQQPFFSQLKDGSKTVEGRCAVGDYNKIDAGALILFNKSLLLQVQDIHKYASFHEMLQVESLGKVLPGVQTIEEGVQVYRNFYSEEKERSNGVLAICLTKSPVQFYDAMFNLLSELGYEGVQRLLGLAHTVGTIAEALPPPPSMLISSFASPYKSNTRNKRGMDCFCHHSASLYAPLLHSWLEVKGSKLIDGARALAKHANRSSNNYWGTFSGSDIEKNELAVNVILRLMKHCCWMNIHIVPLHGIVFEIRDAAGYGARWSGDGTKFIGFLEPYMMDGHVKGWKH